MKSQSLWLVLYSMCLILLGGGYAAIAAAETTKSATQCVSGQCSRAISRTVKPQVRQYRPLVGRIVPRR